MFRRDLFAAALAATLLAPVWSHAASPSSTPIKTDGGKLVGTNGMTLYTLDSASPRSAA